jgi:F0F1-type ATP synthase beta subunit
MGLLQERITSTGVGSITSVQVCMYVCMYVRVFDRG